MKKRQWKWVIGGAALVVLVYHYLHNKAVASGNTSGGSTVNTGSGGTIMSMASQNLLQSALDYAPLASQNVISGQITTLDRNLFPTGGYSTALAPKTLLSTTRLTGLL